MASERRRDKSVEMIARLLELTQQGKLKWHSAAPPKGIDTPVAFQASYENFNLRIYQAERPNPDLGEISVSVLTFGVSRKAPDRITVTILELLDSQGRAVYKFDFKAGLSNLYDSASYSAAGVDRFINAVLGEE
jgi:hypothetical protein